MRKLTFTTILILISVSVFSQHGQAPLAKGAKQINFGLGFSGSGLPAYVGMDFPIHGDWTVGPVLKIVFDEDSKVGALGRVDYHWNRLLDIPSDWDFYLGANLGFLSGNDFDMEFGLQLGGRWYWNNKWALNLEFGGGTGYGSSLGVSRKL